MTEPNLIEVKETTEKVLRPQDIRREDIMTRLSQAGKGNVPVKTLAKQYNVSETTIYSDIIWCFQQIPAPQVELEAKQVGMANERMITIAQAQLVRTQQKYLEVDILGIDKVFTLREKHNLLALWNREIIACMTALQTVLATQVEYLHVWGFKEKIAEKLDVRTLSLSEIHHVVEDVQSAGRKIFSYVDVGNE